MSNLVDYAKEELKRIGMIDSGEPYNDMVTKAILDLVEMFASQGHSNFTAPYTAHTFERLVMFKPLTPLTGEDDEWDLAPFRSKNEEVYQNNRYSSVFKNGKDGQAYNIDGKIFSNDGGKTWFLNSDSRVYITFPYTVPDKPEKVYLNPDNSEEDSGRRILLV